MAKPRKSVLSNFTGKQKMLNWKSLLVLSKKSIYEQKH